MSKPCCEYEHINKGAWSKQGGEKLINYIRKHGEGCCRSLPKAAGLLRCGKSCRLRWINYLRPNLKRGTKFAEDEEDLIIKLHALLGNRWSLIAARLPGRTDNEVKNYWNSHLRRKLVNMGVDLNKHNRFGHKLIPNQMNGWSPSSGTTEFPGPVGAHRCSCRPPSSHGHADSHDRVSDEASSLQDGARLLPDLNLDPNEFPPSSLHGASGGRKPHLGAQEDMKRGLDHTSPTLLLFR